jgi:tetraacyldisaccharide 4'-kinase
VPLEEPAWWYRAEPNATARVLRPVSKLYAWAVERRFQRAQPYCSALPVICVGNLTAGGTGKTPFALLLSEELKRLGERPVFLTRGYGGRHAGPRWVDRDLDLAADVGDEALLLSRVAPTLIARDRAAGARAIAAAGPPSVIVMDDGLQNPTLAKDLAIAVVDASRGIGNGEVLPSGPLRAPLAFQLGLVDAVVVNAAPQAEDHSAEGAGAWLKRQFPGPVLAATPRAAGDTAWIRNARLVAYAGIANPNRFFTLLERLGGRIAESLVLPDHHPFTEKDAERVMGIAARHEAMLVTTEKDWVRLLGRGGRRGQLRDTSRVLPIRLALDERDAGRLSGLIEAVFQTARAHRRPAVSSSGLS